MPVLRGGQRFAEAAEEALAGGGVGDAVGLAGSDGGFVVGAADVANIDAGDDGDGREGEGGVGGGGAELLGVHALQAGEDSEVRAALMEEKVWR